MSTHNYITLMDYLAVLPDPRDRRGCWYEWNYLVTVVAAAMLAGYQTYADMNAWAVRNGEELIRALSPRRKQIPSTSTLRRTACGLDVVLLEEAVASYLQALDSDDAAHGEIETVTGEPLYGQAVDGKTVRTASAYGKTVHLVSIVRHESGVSLNQTRVEGKLNEADAAKQLLSEIPLSGTVTTMDALYTGRELAQQILNDGGHYLMVVKANQPTLYHDIDLAFSALPPTTSDEKAFWAYEKHISQERSHGRFDYRCLESTTALNHYLQWPGIQQVLRRTRWHQHVRTGQSSTHVRYAITSVSRDLAPLDQIERLWRWHWTIENGTHYRRDVSFGEDRCRTRIGDAPQALAALRNAMLGLIRLEGWESIPNAFRHFQANPQHPLRFLGALSS